MNKNFSEATELLYQGEDINKQFLDPEAPPLFLTSAFILGDLEQVDRTYKEKGYTYIRTRNPNRNMLGEAISFLEKGKRTLICSSGMAAITTTYFSLFKNGDHIVANKNIYGETFDAITKLISKFGVTATFVDFSDLDAVEKAMQDNTKMIYTEVASNPTDHLADIEALAKIAHAHGALMMVDNTFTTPFAIKPLTLGADIVISSMTKFLNGHSDALGGSITVNSDELFEQIHEMRMLTGTSGAPMTSYLIYRSLKTADLRIKKQMKNAAALAKALEENPHVLHVNHPSLPSFPEYALATKMFRSGDEITGMLSFEMPNNPEKISAFMDQLELAHYAPTLGGVRTTLSHPLHSSHMHVPEDKLKEMGISYGLMRISVGIEEAEDLIADFTNALKVFD